MHRLRNDAKGPVVIYGSSCFRYESGDHVAVFPTNDSALVNKLGQVLGVDLDVVISLNNLDGILFNALIEDGDLDFLALTEHKHAEFTSLRMMH